MVSKEKQELLDYYWAREPIYHPTHGIPMPKRTIQKMRLLSLLLFAAYLAFSATVIHTLEDITPVHWIISILLAAYCADLISGLTHMFVDFAVSDRENYIHKELFLSRVHHHELKRPAKLNYASLWFSPALYSFVILGLLPASLTLLLPPMVSIGWIIPFWLSVLWFLSVSQLTHAFAHGKARHPLSKKIIGVLQRTRLIISPRTHAKHHREIDCNFSVLNGWSIALLNFIFKHWIEGGLSKNTSPTHQKALMRLNLSYPYVEIL
jgi:hypothetical protein